MIIMIIYFLFLSSYATRSSSPLNILIASDTSLSNLGNELGSSRDSIGIYSNIISLLISGDSSGNSFPSSRV